MSDKRQERIAAKRNEAGKFMYEWGIESDKTYHPGTIQSLLTDFSLEVEQKQWVEIRSEEDLPTVEGSYLWRYVGVKKASFKVQHFTPSNSREWFASVYSHWMLPSPPKEATDDER